MLLAEVVREGREIGMEVLPFCTRSGAGYGFVLGLFWSCLHERIGLRLLILLIKIVTFS